MKYRLIEAYNIKGLIGPKEPKLIVDVKNFRAFIANNPDELLNEVDKKNAIANLLLTSTFIGKPEGSLNDLIESQVVNIRKRRTGGGYLIVQALGELNEYKPTVEKEQDGIHIAFDAIDGDLIREQFKDKIKNAIVTLTFVSDKIIGIDKITDGILLYKDGKSIIYSFSFKEVTHQLTYRVNWTSH